MESINVICSIIIFLYLILINLINEYKIAVRKKEKHIVDINNFPQTINIYCCDLLSSTKLFWITLLELIDMKYYSVKELDNDIIIKISRKKRDEDLLEYQKEVLKYVDKILEDEKEISIEKLEEYTLGDYKFNYIVSLYTTGIRTYIKEHIGSLDRIHNYILPIIISFIYSNQVLYFLSTEINVVGRILISLPFTYITVVLADLFKNKYHKLNNKKYFILFIVSLLLSLLTSNIWNQETNNNYIIFHILMGVFTYMYPLLIIININIIKNNYAYHNKIQKSIITQMDDDDINKNYVYRKLLKKDVDKHNTLIDKYFKILGI